jgi:hypothetical protein
MHYKSDKRTKEPTMSTTNESSVQDTVTIVVVTTVVFSTLVVGLPQLLLYLVSYSRQTARETGITGTDGGSLASHESKEERRRERKESISNGLIVKEWMPNADPPPPVESPTEGDQDTSPSGDAIEAPQSAPAPVSQTNSSPALCAMGSDDCESLSGDEDMAGCAICLSHFEPQELVCESSSSSCQHVFHKDCMVDWLMKEDHGTCPMCREVFLLKTV